MTPVADSLRPRRPPSRLRAGASTAALALDPLRLAGVALFLGAWQAATAVLPPIILPTPAGVAGRIRDDFWSAPALAYYGLADANLCGNLLYTTENVVLAVAAGAVFGIGTGLLSARFASVRAVVDPVVMTAGTVPIIIAAPFLLIWFGVGRASAVCLVLFYVAVTLHIFASRAARNVDPIYEQSARTLGAGSRRVLRDVTLPAAVPEILGGLRIALAGAWGLEAIAELLGSQSGIGKVIEVLAGATDPQGIMAALALLGLVAVLADVLAALAVARATRWSTAAR